MVYTSARPVSVDGVRLDTLAWNIEKIERPTAARRSGDYDVPTMDGVVASLNDGLEPTSYGLSMFVMGTDADGAVPANGRLTTLRDNLDELLHLFGKRHALLDLREVVDGNGTQRRAWAKVTDAILPDIATAGSSGRFTVALVIPAGMWEEPAHLDWVGTSGAGQGTQIVSTMTGSTERINDAVFLVEGPASTPKITDPNTGMAVSLGASLAAGQAWRFSSSSWTSRTGALTLGSEETAGTDATGVTVISGPSRPYGLPLTPIRTSPADGTRIAQVSLSAASGMGAATRLSVRARRKFSA